MINYGYCFQLHVPPPNLMHEYDRMIPASNGDGPSQWILSVDKKKISSFLSIIILKVKTKFPFHLKF